MKSDEGRKVIAKCRTSNLNNLPIDCVWPYIHFVTLLMVPIDANVHNCWQAKIMLLGRSVIFAEKSIHLNLLNKTVVFVVDICFSGFTL